MIGITMLLLLPMVVLGLSNTQLGLINKVIMNKNLPTKHKHLVEAVLYKNYEQWAIKIGSNFKKKHFYKCKHIPYYEISIYSRIGLLNAIRKYNPTKESAMFHLYAIHHIRGQLYKGMTDLSPIVNVSKKRLKLRNTVYERAAHNDEALANKESKIEINESNTLWEHIEETADPFTRRCIRYKFDEDFTTIRTNLEISRIMECSEEKVRSNILKYFITQHLGIILVKSVRKNNKNI